MDMQYMTVVSVLSVYGCIKYFVIGEMSTRTNLSFCKGLTCAEKGKPGNQILVSQVLIYSEGYLSLLA